MNGLLIIDKPEGPSSFDVVRQVRRLCKVRRVGHAGTLDPFATGLLPVAIGQSTRLLEYLTNDDKAYIATMRLGMATDTQDYHGQMLYERPWQHIRQSHFLEVANQFIGTIDQVPPMFSAIKQNGQPLYRLARKGIEVERQARRVHIREIRLESFEPPDIIFSVFCSKGTYIRTLADDIGKKLECGGHLTQLRRTRSGCFGEMDCIKLPRLERLVEEKQTIPLISPADILPDWPSLQVKGAALDKLKNGIAPTIGEFNDICAISENGYVKFLDGKRLVAVAKCIPHGAEKRLGDFEILKVFPEVSHKR